MILRVERLAGGVGAVACVASGALIAQLPEPLSVRDGVFSAAQVARGRNIFRSICTSCHEIEEFTGPGAYLEEMDGKTVWDVFEYISAKMPEDDPGSLEQTDYADVLAYILRRYGLPAGTAELPTDRATLDDVVIGPPDGA